MPPPTTIRLDKDTMQGLDKLANALGRSRSWLIKEAVSQYLEREEKYFRGVRRGLKEAQEGYIFTEQDVLSHFKRKGFKNVGR